MAASAPELGAVNLVQFVTEVQTNNRNNKASKVNKNDFFQSKITIQYSLGQTHPHAFAYYH